MPSISVQLDNIELRPSILSDLIELMVPSAISAAAFAEDRLAGAAPLVLEPSVQRLYKSEVERARHLRQSPADGMLWRDWTVVSGDGVSYGHREVDANAGPSSSMFDGARSVFVDLKVDDVHSDLGYGLNLRLSHGVGAVTVSAPESDVRALASSARDLFAAYRVPEPPADVRPFKIFIAYGGGRTWEVIRDYLQDEGFEVDAFTEQERAGQITIDVVSTMIHGASLALIVMTGADVVGDQRQARQNVIHELGFAQGALGLQRTVLLREAGVVLPSNLAGVTYMEFAPGEIHTLRERVVNLARSVRADVRAQLGA